MQLFRRLIWIVKIWMHFWYNIWLLDFVYAATRERIDVIWDDICLNRHSALYSIWKHKAWFCVNHFKSSISLWQKFLFCERNTYKTILKKVGARTSYMLAILSCFSIIRLIVTWWESLKSNLSEETWNQNGSSCVFNFVCVNYSCND